MKRRLISFVEYDKPCTGAQHCRHTKEALKHISIFLINLPSFATGGGRRRQHVCIHGFPVFFQFNTFFRAYRMDFVPCLSCLNKFEAVLCDKSHLLLNETLPPGETVVICCLYKLLDKMHFCHLKLLRSYF